MSQPVSVIRTAASAEVTVPQLDGRRVKGVVAVTSEAAEPFVTVPEGTYSLGALRALLTVGDKMADDVDAAPAPAAPATASAKRPRRR